MKKFTVIFLSAVLLLSFKALDAQAFDYRYDESPAITWNGIPFNDSAALAIGWNSLVSSSRLVLPANPAMVSGEKGVEIGLSLNFLMYESFQYRWINEGVKKYDSPFSEGKLFPGSAVIGFGSGNWSISGGWIKSALRDFPDFSFRSEYGYEQFETFTGRFSGYDDTFFISAGFRPGRGFRAGWKLEYRIGKVDAAMENESTIYYFIDGRVQLKTSRSGYFETGSSKTVIPGLGLAVDITPRITAGLSLRYPLRGTADRKVVRTFSNSDGVSFHDEFLSEDDHFEVPSAVLGILFRKGITRMFGSEGDLRFAAELGYYRWSEYRFVFFGEEQVRDTTDTLRVSAGSDFFIKRGKKDLHIRLGLGMDRQPVRSPVTWMKFISAGADLRKGKTGAGIAISWITGSPGGITQNDLLVCTSLYRVL